VASSNGELLGKGMSAIERNLRQRRDKASHVDIACYFEAAHQALRSASIEDVDDDEPRRVSPYCAALAQKGKERRPGMSVNGQRAAQTMDKTLRFDAFEIHLPLR
jgi:hypothetical protein